jgi:metallophosphoesterase (TIGR00282 family)
MRILFVGDVVGAPGRRIVRQRLKGLKRELGAELTIVNGENAAGGAGLTTATAEELFASGADVITTGNHVWDKRDILGFISREPRVLRPANYPEGSPGAGVVLVPVAGTHVAVLNLMGRVFMPLLDDPFRTTDRILDEIRGKAPVAIVDFHAEATSEKIAFAWSFDGRVSAVLGTHTHVATADARVLPGGTAYITDAGMTGPFDSVIGVKKEQAIERFRTSRSIPYETAEGDVRLSAVRIDVDSVSGRAQAIERLELSEGEGGGTA